MYIKYLEISDLNHCIENVPVIKHNKTPVHLS